MWTAELSVWRADMAQQDWPGTRQSIQLLLYALQQLLSFRLVYTSRDFHAIELPLRLFCYPSDLLQLRTLRRLHFSRSFCFDEQSVNEHLQLLDLSVVCSGIARQRVDRGSYVACLLE
jgi:hypothetical protein